MKTIGILLLINGATGIALGSMMHGDIGIAAIIGALSSILSGIGFLLPSKGEIESSDSTPVIEKEAPKKSRIVKYGLIIAGVLVLLIAGLILLSDKTANQVSHDEFLTKEQFEQLYSDAKPFKGYQVDFYGRVFKSPEKTEKYISLQVYANNDDNKNTIIRLDDTTATIQEGDILHIVGQVHDMFRGENVFGAVLKAPAIIAKKVEKVDYATAFAPPIKTINVNQVKEQNGYVMEVKKVELAEQETRVYLKVTNESADPIDFHSYSSVLVQGNKQSERISNYQADYPEINGDNIQTGVTEEGIVVFGKVDVNGDNFKVTFKGSSDNWEIRTEPFVFEIPLKHEIVQTDNNQVAKDKPSEPQEELFITYIDPTTKATLQYPKAWGDPWPDTWGHTKLYETKTGAIQVASDFISSDMKHADLLADYLVQHNFDEAWYTENDPDGYYHGFGKLDLNNGYEGYAYTVRSGMMRDFNYIVFNQIKAVRLNVVYNDISNESYQEIHDQFLTMLESIQLD